jgi:hypothetical protein
MGEEVAGGWRRSRNEEAMFYTRKQIVLFDKSKGIEIDRSCDSYGIEENSGFWWGKTEGKDQLVDVDVDGKILLGEVLGEL